MRPKHPAVKMFESRWTGVHPLVHLGRPSSPHVRHFAASIEQREGDTGEGPDNDLTHYLLMDLDAWNMEVRVGIEPTNKGFADPGLTTWLPHRMHNNLFGR